MPLSKVALLGTRGRLGPFLLAALVKAPSLEVSILQRAESSATLPKEYEGKVRVITLPPDFVNDENEVAKALAGIEAVVVAIPGSRNQEQMAIMNACIKAKVRRFIPADFGSVDSSDQVCTTLVPIYGAKSHMRGMLSGISLMYPSLTWTSLVSGHFFDYGLEEPLLGFDIKASPPTAQIFDDGNKKWSTSTRQRIGEALVAVFEHEEQTANRMLYIQSFRVSQNEVLAALEKVSGKKFEVSRVSSEEYIAQKQEEMKRGDKEDATEEMVGVLSLTRTDWKGYKDFANEELGLKEQDLEGEVRKVWEASRNS